MAKPMTIYIDEYRKTELPGGAWRQERMMRLGVAVCPPVAAVAGAWPIRGNQPTGFRYRVSRPLKNVM